MVEARSVFRVRHLAGEAIAGIMSRPSRSALTGLGTLIGVAALVATLGLARTTGSRIVSQFDALAGTEVVVRPTSEGFDPGSSSLLSPIPWDSEERLVRLNGVVAAGTKSDVDLGESRVRAVPVIDPSGASDLSIPVIAASGGLFSAVRAEVRTGRLFDRSHNDLNAPVAVLGPSVAERLSVVRVDNQPVIFLGDEPVVVVGILADVRREPDLLNAIVVPDGFAREELGLIAPTAVHVDTELGAAQLIGQQAALALAPNTPELLRVQTPPDPASLRYRVGEEINALFLLLGGIALLVGAIGIANVTLVSVLERTAEVGLRRSLGATQRHVVILFLTESAALGLLAGTVGTSLGVLTVVGVSSVNGWVPVLQPWLPFAAPLVGLTVGLVSGAYPAWRAGAIEPIAALRTQV